MTKDEAVRRTAAIRGKLEDALDDLVDAFFDGVHEAMGYASWDEYVGAEFGNLRFKVAAAERGERVRELRGRGMPVKVAAELFGVTERTVKRDSVGGQMSPPVVDAHTVTESIRVANGHAKSARESIVDALRYYPDMPIPSEIEPPRQDDVVIELMVVAFTHGTVLLAMSERVRALKTAHGKRRAQIQEALRVDAEVAGRLSERTKVAHYTAKFLGRSEELEAMARALGLAWSDDDGHYLILSGGADD